MNTHVHCFNRNQHSCLDIVTKITLDMIWNHKHFLIAVETILVFDLVPLKNLNK